MYCEYEATTKGSLKIHTESVHKKIKFSCNNCDKEYTQQCNLKIHVESVHEKVKYSCNLCQQAFSLKSDLRIHIESVHENVKYPCITNVANNLHSREILRDILNQSMKKSSILVIFVNMQLLQRAT